MPIVLLLSGDLMFAGPIRTAAQEEGYQFQLSGSLGEKQQLPELEVVVVDLAFTKLTPAEILTWAEACPERPKVIGFGPHVDEGGLQEASRAGFDAVVTRGQMHRDARAILRRLASSPK